MIDVGQGDSIHIKTTHKKNILRFRLRKERILLLLGRRLGIVFIVLGRAVEDDLSVAYADHSFGFQGNGIVMGDYDNGITLFVKFF